MVEIDELVRDVGNEDVYNECRGGGGRLGRLGNEGNTLIIKELMDVRSKEDCVACIVDELGVGSGMLAVTD